MTGEANQAVLDTSPSDRLGDLAQIIGAYNRVTDNLRSSHEALARQVERLQHDLNGANAQLQRTKRLAALGEMAAGIAHEVRNPLGAIQLYAGMLVADLKPLESQAPQALGVARKIADAVRTLDAVVGDVLSFSRELKPRRVALAPASLLRGVVDAHRPAIEAAGVNVVIDTPDALELVGDRDLLHRALLNLVRNAVEAMREANSGHARLSLGIRRDGEHFVVTVGDTGPGIDDEAIDRIFNPFFTTRHTGTGLGLAIVHRIADAHGGTINVWNAVGEDGERAGAVFELRLPDAGAQRGLAA